jgi:hypothetical protein
MLGIKMIILPGRYVGEGFYQKPNRIEKLPLECAIEIDTCRTECKLHGYWKCRQLGSLKHTVNFDVVKTDCENINDCEINCLNFSLSGTFFSAEDLVSGLFKAGNGNNILGINLREIKNGIEIVGVSDREIRICFNVKLYREDKIVAKSNVVTLGKYA